MKNNIIYTTYSFIFYLVFSLGIYASPAPSISAEGAILIEPLTNTVLYSKNADEKFYPASTTKILTTLILIEEMSPQEILTKTADSVRNVPSDSSHIGLKPGDQYTYLDGLHAILMGSDNFVSHDMAILNSKTMESFADKMNQKAMSLGALSSNFVNPHGYHDINHYTSPYDLAQITTGAFNNETLEQIASTFQYDFTVVNTNQTIPLTHTAPLVNPSSNLYNANVTAVKTGYHTPAGYTLVAKAVYDNIELIGVVMKSGNQARFEEMNALFEYGQANFNTKSFGPDSYYVENISYSPWAKDAIKHALSQGWIPRSMRNYTGTISATEFISLLQKVIDSTYSPSLYQYNTSSEFSMYMSTMPITRQDTAYMIYSLCNKLLLKPYRYYDQIDISDISQLPLYYQDAIHYVTSAKLLGSPTGPFSPAKTLTYEQAISIMYKLDILFSTSIPYSFQLSR